MAIFFKKKRPLTKSERYYEEEPVSTWEKMKKFPIFVVISLILVVAIVASVFLVNINNNAFSKLSDGLIKNVDSGSFEYEICSSLNGETTLFYDGALEFDLDAQKFESVYHAIYPTYEYDAAVFAYGADSFRGNLYGGKWSVENYSDKALDIFAFYRDFRKGEFDAGATARFTESNDKFNAVQLDDSVKAIIKELTTLRAFNEVWHQDIVTEDSGAVTVTLSPEVDKIFNVITEHIGSAFTSADAYSEFKEKVQYSQENMRGCETLITYHISEQGYLTDFTIDHTVNSQQYMIEITMSNFKKAQVEIPEDFITATDYDK